MTTSGNGFLQANDSHMISQAILEGFQCFSPKWYFTRKEIEENSPSRKDGIILRKETHLRSLYCSFLQDLGIKLKVPQLTIATSMVLCHRFYLCQSHAKNEWQTIASASMFLSCKVEETPRKMKDVVVVAYETIYRRDPAASQRMKQKDVYEKQKELVVIGERLLLGTVAFDLNIQHPYKPLVSALKRLQISDNNIAKVAWNFVNDWLCTTLCLQYKPHYIAAGSMYLAAKLHKFKLPSEKGKVWWLQFDVTPNQLEEVLQQMVMLLEQNKKPAVPPSHNKPAQAKTAANERPESPPLHDKVTQAKDAVKEIQPITESRALGGSVVSSDSCGFSVPATTSDSRLLCEPVTTSNICDQSGTNTISVSCVQSGPITTRDLRHRGDQVCNQGQVSMTTSDSCVLSVSITTPDSCALSRSVTTDNSCVLSVPIATSDPRHGIDEETCDDCKEILPYQTSDCGSSHSVVEDGDRSSEAEGQALTTVQSNQAVSCNIVAISVGLSEIDKDRIRQALKRRKFNKVADSKTLVVANDEDKEGDTWIERELESGIEVEYSPSAKRQRLV
ncbi:hypothetical protein GIB67_005565 [Kingdonia uniflora]|uniref:Cyclin-like domain-containing protein n=1 Tax=Kingdonia uniflora TaxID=39325 RepID=A0A7J7NI04_9MAGN|nr:hypothetical protein GIB67_005565 [Kingdonia uniflora]